MDVLGIDIGGSGIKAAPVDVTTGKFTAERVKVPTPRPALPDAVAEAVKELVADFGWSGPAGVTFPGVVIDGVTRTAANLDPAWIGLDARALFGAATGLALSVLNDADAAGLAEMTFGAGAGERGTVLMLTFGTGIGSALFTDGLLVPNTEFGHIEIRGKDAETARLGTCQGTARPELGQMGRPRRRVPGARGGPGVAQPVHHRRRHQPQVGQVHPAAEQCRGPGSCPAAMHNDAGIVGAAMTAVPA